MRQAQCRAPDMAVERGCGDALPRRRQAELCSPAGPF